MLDICSQETNRSAFSSTHTKLVKRSIARVTLKNCVLRSCHDHHTMSESLQAQADRLVNAGYPLALIPTVTDSVLKSLKSKVQEAKKSVCINVIFYVHKVSHGLKKLRQRACIQTVFSAPNKKGGMCKVVNAAEPPRATCGKKHATSFVDCRHNVAYEISLSCGAVYFGQSGMCLNDCLREHSYIPYELAPAVILCLTARPADAHHFSGAQKC